MTLPCQTDPDAWFASDHDTIQQAREACQSCPAIDACRDLGRTERWGVWGGESRLRGRRYEKRTHCPHGHPYTPDNTAEVWRGGYLVQVCRTCKRDRDRARRAAA